MRFEIFFDVAGRVKVGVRAGNEACRESFVRQKRQYRKKREKHRKEGESRGALPKYR